MLDQIAGGSHMALTTARPVDAEYGKPLPAGSPVLFVPQSSDREYAQSTQQALGNYSPATAPYRYISSVIPRGGNLPMSHISLQVNPGNNVLRLSNQINVAVAPQAMGQGMTMNSSQDETISMDTLQPFGHVVKEWKNGSNFSQLMLRTANAPNQARLCWNMTQGELQRLLCYLWQVPKGWTYGQPLEILGVSVTQGPRSQPQHWRTVP